MDQPESCFVCNSGVLDKGVSLSMETTLASKTPFLTKLTQLLGDAFMLVILEDDKICLRCVNLINRTDRLEQDLRKTQSIIRGYLNEKYGLNEEVEFSTFGEELEGPNLDYIYDEESLLHSPNIDVKDDYSYQDEGYKAKYLTNDEELFENSTHSENACDVRVKSEPVINSDQYFNSMNSHNLSENCDQTISEALLRKLPEDDDTFKEKHSTGVGSSWSEINHSVQESQEITVLKLKKEKLSVDYKENNVPTSAPHASNHISPVNETSEKSIAVPTDDHSHLDEKRSEIKSLCDVSISVKEIKDVLKSNNNSSSKGVTGEASEAKLPNIAAGKELSEEIKGKTYSSNLSKPKNPKCIRKEKERTDSKVRKLRPILPKVTNVNEVLSSLYIIQHSDCNEILNENAKYNLSIKPESSDFFQNSKEIKSSDRDRESNTNQCIKKETDQLNAITETPLIDDLNTHCSADLINPVALESHENDHVQDRFKCSFCPKSFKKKLCAKNHETLHTGNFAHYCEFCGQGFATLAKLEQHRRKHTKEECYMCDVCGKKFLYKGTYWIHRKWHDNPFPYKCDDCGKPFKHSSRLSIHRRKHRGERPYKCSYCPLTFDVSTTLKRHVLLHTKQFPYKCVTCDQGFTTRSKYTNHLARKHDIFVEKPSIDPRDYKMAVCNSEKEKTGVESISSEKTINFNESSCQVEILENSELIFNNSSDCRIEIILPPSSMLSDNSFSNISWLT